ncbi:MAG: hypothetical protein FWH11_03200 [Micrococcales bacterium]|nr:hypothetical protein [Micrococcales bacterium]
MTVAWWAWLLLWLVLVAGTVVGGYFLARSLWDKAMALFDELGRLQALSQRLEVVVEAAPSTWVHPLVATAADHDRWRAGIAQRQAQRQVRRTARHEAAFRRWIRWWG